MAGETVRLLTQIVSVKESRSEQVRVILFAGYGTF
jgi:hypothetical protein